MKKIVAILMLAMMLFSLCCCEEGGKSTVNIPIFQNTVTFVANGGSAVESQSTRLVQAPPATYREGYDFEGWFLDKATTVAAQFPLKVNEDITLYAKWLKIEGKIKCRDIAIKFLDSNYSNVLSFDIALDDLNLAALASKGYVVDIVVTYDVYYKKDYDIPWDIGYAGAPKYEVSIVNSKLDGTMEYNLETSVTSQTRKIKLRRSVSDMINDEFSLVFFTDNVQNVVFFKNIVIRYTCTN